MAPINHGSTETAWNDAYDRLVTFLRAFDLGDHAYVSQLALDLHNQARVHHQNEPGRDPTTVTLELAQKKLTEWLAANLDQQHTAASHVLPTGYIAILLSQSYRTSPRFFLSTPVPEELRQALRETLLVTGPDLNISSMTPRHLDYGPMLHFARQTWHRLDLKEFFIALVFWGAVYTVFYWWLSQAL